MATPGALTSFEQQMELARSLVGERVRFLHETEGGRVHEVVRHTTDALIELKDMGGYFAPHLFEIVETVIAPLIDAAEVWGWIIGNGDETNWRGWDECGPCWVTEPEKALRFARREDAETFCQTDEDAWTIKPYPAVTKAAGKLHVSSTVNLLDEKILQHFAWMTVFLDFMGPENWKDMRDRCARQKGELLNELGKQADSHRRDLAEAREKFTMHTAHVGAWLSAAASEFGIPDGKTTVQDVLSHIMDEATRLKSAATEARKAALEEAAKIAENVRGGYTANVRIDESEQELIPDPDGPWVLNSAIAKAIRALAAQDAPGKDAG